MKYLTKFEEEIDYDKFIVSSSFTLPNVSKVMEDINEDEHHVEFNPYEAGKYFWMFACDDGQITFTIPAQNKTDNIPYISWSTDDGETWETVNNDDAAAVVATINVRRCDKVLFKSECVSGTNWNTKGTEATSYPARFGSTMPVTIGGNIASLMYGDDFRGVVTAKTSATHTFWKLFAEMDVIYATSLYLPFTAQTLGMYQKLFEG